MKEINRRQNGQVLIIMLIVLALGGIVLAPTLNHAATSIKHQQLIETDALELYAADSGIDYALYELSNGETAIEDYPLNGKTVSVSITDQGDGSYLVTSTATSTGGSNTTIRTGVSGGTSFAFLLDNAITSDGDVTLQPNSSVIGNVTASGNVDGEENVTGNVTDNVPIDNWPSAEDFSTHYWTDVEGLAPYSSDTIDLGGSDTTVGPLYVDGDLDIYNSSNTEATLILEDTLYIAGKAEIGKSPKDFTLDLNGQTIFVDSDLTGGGASGTALWIGQNCAIIGSGCIIAVGDVYFEPKGDVGDEGNFVFVMSVEGITTLQPEGDFYGSIAGSVEVNLRPGCYLEWNSLGSGEGYLNFPPDTGVVGGSTEDMVLGGWDIS